MRLPAYEFGRDVVIELQEAIEDIRMLINNGKYTPGVQSSEPTYTGEEGEDVIFNAGATMYRFSYINGAWYYLTYTAGPLP